MSSQSKQERQIVMGEVKKEVALQATGSLANSQLKAKSAHIPEFKKATRFSFRAEWDVIGNDIVVHFYLPKQAKPKAPREQEAWMEYWVKRFPEKLSSTAKKYFDADYPRILAKYTEEVASWWFKAQGFGVLLDPGVFLSGFFDQLDEALKNKENNGTTSESP